MFPGGIASLVPAPDGARIAVVDLTGRVRIANVPGFEIAAELPRDHVTASASGYEIVLEFSGDGRRLATGADHLVTLWDARTLRYQFNLPHYESMVTALAFAPDSSTLALAGGRELISLIDLPAIEAELASLGLDRPEPQAAANPETRPRHTFRRVRWPAGFFIAGRFTLLEHALDLEPNQPELAMELSWLYATGPDPLPRLAQGFASRPPRNTTGTGGAPLRERLGPRRIPPRAMERRRRVRPPLNPTRPRRGVSLRPTHPGHVRASTPPTRILRTRTLITRTIGSPIGRDRIGLSRLISGRSGRRPSPSWEARVPGTPPTADGDASRSITRPRDGTTVSDHVRKSRV